MLRGKMCFSSLTTFSALPRLTQKCLLCSNVFHLLWVTNLLWLLIPVHNGSIIILLLLVSISSMSLSLLAVDNPPKNILSISPQINILLKQLLCFATVWECVWKLLFWNLKLLQVAPEYVQSSLLRICNFGSQMGSVIHCQQISNYIY